MRPGWKLQRVRMMLVHGQKLLNEQFPKELLTEWKNIEKQKCMSLATVSRDPEELTPAYDAALRRAAGVAPGSGHTDTVR